MREHVRSLDTVRFPPRYDAYARLYRSKLSCKSRKISINRCTDVNADLRTHVSSMISMKTRYPVSNLASTYSTYGGLCLRRILSGHERSYHVNCTRSRPIPEVKLRRVQPVVRCVSTCEAWILFVFPAAIMPMLDYTAPNSAVKVEK